MPTPTKDSLTAKLTIFKQQQEQLVANANGLSGAIQVLEQLLKECDEPTPVEETK